RDRAMRASPNGPDASHPWAFPPAVSAPRPAPHAPRTRMNRGRSLHSRDMAAPVPLPILRPAVPRAPPHDAKAKCVLFGICGHPEGARSTCLGLCAQQHRGEESAGITVTDGDRLEGITGMGLVPEVFDERKIQYLEAHYNSPASHKAAGIKATGNGDL